MNSNWILKNGLETIPCSTFPFAYRTMYNIVRKASETKGGNVASVMKGLSLQGPVTPRGDRRNYTYASATQLATDNGLLTPDGQINSREFKKK